MVSGPIKAAKNKTNKEKQTPELNEKQKPKQYYKLKECLKKENQKKKSG